jgi:ribosomal protein L15E
MKIIGEEDKSKIIEGIATATLNSFNINGLVQAAKFYSVHLANEQYTNMSEDDRLKVLSEIKTAEEKAKESTEAEQKEEEVVTA